MNSSIEREEQEYAIWLYDHTEQLRGKCEAELNHTDRSNLTPGAYCPGVFDGWVCWPDTPADTTVYRPCPWFITGFDRNLNGHKECLENGSWFKHPETGKAWTNYTSCVNLSELEWELMIVRLQETGYLVSLLALLISLGILFHFKSLRCTRIILHMNLFSSFAVNNALWLLFFFFSVDNAKANPLWCRWLHVVTHYFLLTNYFWMLAEGLYLHTVLVNAFGAEDRLVKWLFVLGWVIPWPIITTYAAWRGSDPDPEVTKECWMNEERPYFQVMAVPVCLSLALNFVFLINIVRVLWTKLRAGPQVGSHAERPSRTLLQATRATLLLLPLLGLQYILTPFQPEKLSPFRPYYDVTSSIFTSFQGLAVAILYCFCNGEVLAQMRRRMDFVFHRHRANSYTATTVSFIRSTPCPQAGEERV